MRDISSISITAKAPSNAPECLRTRVESEGTFTHSRKSRWCHTKQHTSARTTGSLGGRAVDGVSARQEESQRIGRRSSERPTEKRSSRYMRACSRHPPTAGQPAPELALFCSDAICHLVRSFRGDSFHYATSHSDLLDPFWLGTYGFFPKSRREISQLPTDFI